VTTLGLIGGYRFDIGMQGTGAGLDPIVSPAIASDFFVDHGGAAGRSRRQSLNERNEWSIFRNLPPCDFALCER
jgi:hypothetical protein